MLSASQWQNSRLEFVPPQWRGRVKRQYDKLIQAVVETLPGQGERTANEQAANAYLSSMAEKFAHIRLPVGASDDELIQLAEKMAADAFTLAEVTPSGMTSTGNVTGLLTVPELRARLTAWVERFGIAAPDRLKVRDRPAIARMTCPIWWRRALRKYNARALEGAAIQLGYVHRNAEIYASDATVQRRLQQRRRNALMLENTRSINLDTGDEFTLAELAAKAVSNPRIRRGELMTRIAGFEAVAKGMGHVAEFVTLTCPSRFHRMRKAGPRMEENPRYDGSTPRQAQEYLVKTFARIRAKLARLGIQVYGFRIAEPHNDACPHWHLLLFMPEFWRKTVKAAAVMRTVFLDHAMRDSPDESGAKKHRVTFEAIDWSRGSAAGYVAKYVSKNIDGGGYEVQGDIEGSMDAVFPGHRVEAWASTWGIRQFQQIGGPPVGVWRELRRLPDDMPHPSLVEQARTAADCGTAKGHDAAGASGNWRRFVEVMGGPVKKRKFRPLSVSMSADGCKWSWTRRKMQGGGVSRYGEASAPVPMGVWYDFDTLEEFGLCRRQVWHRGTAESKRFQWENKRIEGVGFLGRFSATRTRVNNCTPVWVKDSAKVSTNKIELSAAERDTLDSWERFRRGEFDGTG